MTAVIQSEGIKRALFGSEALPRLPARITPQTAQPRRTAAPLRDCTNQPPSGGWGRPARGPWKDDAKPHKDARPAKAPKRHGRPRSADDPAPNRPARRVVVAYASPEAALDARNALAAAAGEPKPVLSPSAKRRARRKARRLATGLPKRPQGEAWGASSVSPDAASSKESRTPELATPVARVTPSPESLELGSKPDSLEMAYSKGDAAQRTPSRRRRRSNGRRGSHSTGKHPPRVAIEGGLVLTSLTPGSDERDRKRTFPCPPKPRSPDCLPPMGPTPTAPGSRGDELLVVDPSPTPTAPRCPDSPDEAGVAVAPDVDLFEPAGSPMMMRCVTRTKLLEYLEDEDDVALSEASPPDSPRRPDDDEHQMMGVSSLRFRGNAIDERDPAWSWRYDFMASDRRGEEEEEDLEAAAEDDDDEPDSPPLKKADDRLDDDVTVEADFDAGDDPFAAPVASLGATVGPPRGGGGGATPARCPSRGPAALGDRPLQTLPEERPLLIDAQGVPLLDAQAVDLCTERFREAEGAAPPRRQFRRKAGALRVRRATF